MESQEERDRIATTLRGLDALLGIEEEVIKEEAKKVGMVQPVAVLDCALSVSLNTPLHSALT